MSLEELLLLMRGTTSDEGEARAAHVDRCSTCDAARSWLERLLEATDAGPLDEPPASVADRAIQFFARQPVEKGQRRSWSLAQLVYDSLRAPLPAGVRGRGAGRRVLYQADWADLDLEIREDRLDPETFHVMGRLLPRGDAPREDMVAVLWSEETMVAQAEGDPVGLFELSGIRPGTYRLEIWAPAQGGAMAVEPFLVGADAP